MLGLRTVLGKAEPAKSGGIRWECRCECGDISPVVEKDLLKGKSLQCKKCADRKSGLARRHDLRGSKWGYLTAIELVETVKGNPIWLFQCDCGNLTKGQTGQVVIGDKKSCGCMTSYLKGRNMLKRSSPLTDWHRKRKGSAENRGHVHDISDEYAVEVASNNCQYCGDAPKSIIPPYLEKRRLVSVSLGNTLTVTESDFDDYMLHGLDRVDSAKGYTKDNIVSCCTTCNRMKMAHEVTDFLDHCRKIADRHQ